jgi:uridine kinase
MGCHSFHGNALIISGRKLLIVAQDSFYKTLDQAALEQAFRNEYDFDSPDAIDFDVLVDRLRDLKAGYVLLFGHQLWCLPL